MISVFLSASIPLPDRDRRFFDTADVIAIREAIKALVGEVIPRGVIVFGGHPAITPLIATLMRGIGKETRDRLILYQSAFFAREFPEDVDEFVQLRLVEAVGGSREQSLAKMRSQMISGTEFDAGVFIGGMEGVVDEFNLFKARWPHAKLWPIASTGAAAMELYKKVSTPFPEELLTEITYPTLFRNLFREL